MLRDAHAVADAGAYAVVLEVVEADIAADITAQIAIPTIGIGSGPSCDAQVLVLHDILGLYPDPPKFAKQYANLANDATRGIVGTAGLEICGRKKRVATTPPTVGSTVANV